jgi:hypothetical protein
LEATEITESSRFLCVLDGFIMFDYVFFVFWDLQKLTRYPVSSNMASWDIPQMEGFYCSWEHDLEMVELKTAVLDDTTLWVYDRMTIW